MTIGENIRKTREQKGISQSNLARLAGVSNDYMNKIECDKVSNVGLEKLAAIAFALNISPVGLFRGTPFGESFVGNQPGARLRAPEEDGYIKPDKALSEFIKIWEALSSEQRKTVVGVAKSYVPNLFKKSKAS